MVFSADMGHAVEELRKARILSDRSKKQIAYLYDRALATALSYLEVLQASSTCTCPPAELTFT